MLNDCSLDVQNSICFEHWDPSVSRPPTKRVDTSHPSSPQRCGPTLPQVESAPNPCHFRFGLAEAWHPWRAKWSKVASGFWWSQNTTPWKNESCFWWSKHQIGRNNLTVVHCWMCWFCGLRGLFTICQMISVNWNIWNMLWSAVWLIWGPIFFSAAKGLNRHEIFRFSEVRSFVSISLAPNVIAEQDA